MAQPTNLEQLMLELINEARLDPIGNAERYISSYAAQATSADADINSALNFFDVNGIALKAAYDALVPVQALAWNAELADAADFHSQYMINENGQEHEFPGGPTLDERLDDAGYDWSAYGENIFAWSDSVLYGHAGFMVDWGPGPDGMQPGAGHRVNIMNGNFREVGIGIIETANSYPAGVGPQSTTQDFGDRSVLNTKAILTGVAFDDNKINDDFYSVGEGVQNLNISVGADNTNTWSSGGYSLEIAGSASARTITFSGATLSASATFTATLLANNNYKLDVMDVATGATLRTSVSGLLGSNGGILNIVGLGMLGLTLTGAGGNNNITGGKGADIIDGGIGNDTLSGGAGADKFIFSVGTDMDTVVGFNRSEGDKIELVGYGAIQSFADLVANTTITVSGGDTKIDFGSGDVLTLKGIAGVSGADFGLDSTITGTAGADTINATKTAAGQAFATDGKETILGLAGNDNINALGGNDTVDGGDNDDIMVGGAGTDTLSYASAAAGVTVSLAITGQQDTKGAGKDTASQFENLTGSDFNDTLTGDAKVNVIDGGKGDDIINGGFGSDDIDGGEGNDTVSFVGVTTPITLTLNAGAGTANYKNGTTPESDSVENIENIIGGTGADKLTGDAANNVIEGGAGDDILNGGDGIDTVSYASATAAITVNLATLVQQNTGGAGKDTLSNFENIIGGKGGDTLTGDANANKIEGGAGNDTLIGGEGADALFGGDGIDTISFATSVLDVVVNLLTGTGANGDADNDTYSGIENIIGSNQGDSLVGDGSANKIEGGGGNDSIYGNLGNDILDGGAGSDVVFYTYLSTNLTATLGTWTSKTGTVAATKVTAAANDADTISNIDGIIAGTGNDVLTGNAGDNLLWGNAGNDLLTGGAGIDSLNGDLGNDTINYLTSAKGVTVDLTVQDGSTGQAAQGGSDAEGDILLGIENVIGSGKDDKITGDGADNIIEGGAGNDILDGGGNTAAGDTVSYAATTAAVTVNLNVLGAQDTKGAGKDTLSNFENIIGGKGADFLIGDGAANILTGGAGNDTLYGLNDNDTLIGGDGDDRLIGGLGNDTLNGGLGNDIFDYDGKGEDTIQDFAGVGTAAGDKIRIANTFTNFTDLKAAITYLAGDLKAEIDFGGGNILTVHGIGAGKQFDASDFIFNTAPAITSNGGGTSATITINENTAAVTTVTVKDTQSDKAFYTLSGADAALFNIDPLTGVLAFNQAPDFENPQDAGGDNTYNVTVTAFDGLSDTQDLAITVKNLTTETITGTANDDLFIANSDIEAFKGLGGIDTVSYANAAGGITVSMLGSNNSPGIAKGDTFTDIEKIIGGNFNDQITGNTLGNFLLGGDGDDLLIGGLGSDTLDGGADIDTASFAGISAAVVATIGNIATYKNGSVNDIDTLIDIENLIGGSGADTLTGDALDNVIEGGLGDDTLNGGEGAETLGDTVSYANATAAVTVNLSITTQQNTGGAGKDTIQDFENILGSSKDDKLTGDSEDNRIDGGAGNDIIDGGAGNDILEGGAGTLDTVSYLSAAAGVTVALHVTAQQDTVGAGLDTLSGFERLVGSNHDDHLGGHLWNDTVDGGAGDDIVEGLGGDDILIGGANGLFGDTVSYVNTTLGGVTVDLSKTTKQSTGGSGNVTVSGFENLTGSIFGDVLTGDKNANRISGGDGDDVINGGLGNDILDGGLGFDTVSFAGITTAITFTLGDKDVSYKIGSVTETDTLTSIEGVIGGSGADVLTGGLGDDVIDGGTGGADKLDGGAHSVSGDILSFASSTAALTLDLNAAVISIGVNAGWQLIGGDFVKSFEGLRGGSGADKLIGDGGDNVLQGGAGNDTLIGGGGTNTLFGDLGNDTFIGGAGIDAFYGGDGLDTVSYAASAAAVTVDFRNGIGTGGDALGDSYSEVENVIGSAFDDLFVNSGFANKFDGGLGNDTVDYYTGNNAVHVSINLATGKAGDFGLSSGDTFFSIENIIADWTNDFVIGNAVANKLDGKEGNDFIQGGLGSDTLIGGDGIDTVSFADITSGVTLTLGAGTTSATYKNGSVTDTDTVSGFENIIGGTGADIFTGDANENKIEGGLGDDTINGGASGDTLDGGAGIDTLSYASSASFVSVQLNNTGQATIGAGGASNDAASDIATNFEYLVGSAFGDYLTGNNVANNLFGGDGADYLAGLAGADKLVGGNGDDTADYSASGGTLGVTINLTKQGTYDELTGKFSGGTAQTGGDAAGDFLYGIEHVTGSNQNDILTGDGVRNILVGMKGNDTLIGGGGDDDIYGDEGNDLLDGGAGADDFYGGDGIDTVTYASATAGVVANLGNAAANTGDAQGDTYNLVENLIGTSKNDTLTGNNDANVITGGDGNDTIDGGQGNDTLTGGAGNDKFVIGASSGVDTITDFAFGAAVGDQIDLSAYKGLSDLDAVKAAGVNVGKNYEIDLGSGNKLILNNVQEAQLAANDFIYGSGNKVGSFGPFSMISKNSTTDEQGETMIERGPAISADGNFVVFSTASGNFASDDLKSVFNGGQGGNDVFLYDRSADTLTLISRDTDGDPAQQSFDASISGSGDIVAFTSGAEIIKGVDTNFEYDIYVYDRSANSVKLISLNENGSISTSGADIGGAQVSADGRYVVFESRTNMTLTDTDAGDRDIYRYDLKTDTITLATDESITALANGKFSNPEISATGRYITFVSDDQLVAGDKDSATDLYRLDTTDNSVELVSAASGTLNASWNIIDSGMSADGRFIVFQAVNNMGTPADSFDDQASIYVKDMETGTLSSRLMSPDVEISAVNLPNGVSMSGDGRFVAIHYGTDFLLPGDFVWANVHVFDRENNYAQVKVTNPPFDEGELNESLSPVLNDNGSVIAFTSYAYTLVSPDTNDDNDVFISTRAGLQTVVVGDWDVDTLTAKPDGSRVIGYGGDDTLIGGAGADTFVWGDGYDTDTIQSFGVGVDAIDLRMVEDLTTINQLTLTENAGDTVVSYDGNDILIVEGILPAALTPQHFILN